MPPKREIKVLTAILADEQNQDKTAEEIAEELILALDELRVSTHRVAIVASYAWTGEEPTLAVLGPFSTRAPAAAKAVGEGMAGTGRGGTGKWLRVPVYANAKAAWDAVMPTPDEVRERRLNEALGQVFADNGDLFNPWARFGPVCCCGVRRGGFCLVHKKLNEAA